MAQRVNFTKHGLIDMEVNDVINIIKNGELLLNDPNCGNYSLREITTGIRIQQDPTIQNELKMRFLPVVTFNGIWDGTKISEYSNITALDFDHISDMPQFNQTLMVLKSSPFVYAIFKTFKTYRIKALVLHDNPDQAKHKEMYEQLIALFQPYGIDTLCKDISRKMYIPWDENIWVNDSCVPYHFVPSVNLQIPSSQNLKIHNSGTRMYSGKKQKSPQSIVNILHTSWTRNHPEYWQKGQRANSIFICACQFCEYGIPQRMAEEYFLAGGWVSHDFTKDEVIKHVNGAYSRKQKDFASKIFI